MNPKAYYLCDIDGTIADLSHRLHHIQKQPSDWDAFFADCHNDEPIHPVIQTVQFLAKSGAEIILLTGRSDAVKDKTVDWLEAHGVPFSDLWMRKAGDHRQDDIVKGELLDEITKEIPQDYIVGAFEDRNQVVNMLRNRGIRVFQVADGNF